MYSSNHNVSNNTGTLLIDNLDPNESLTINFDLSLDQFDLNIDSLDPILMIITSKEFSKPIASAKPIEYISVVWRL